MVGDRRLPGDFHGTTNGYNNHGCRCAPCRKAHTEYLRAYRARRGPREEREHTATLPPRRTYEAGRPLDVLAFIERSLDPDAPLTVDIARRRLTVPELRAVHGQLRYVKARQAELAAAEFALVGILRLKDQL